MSVCIYFTSLFFIYFCTEFTVQYFMTNLFTYSFIYHLPINFKSFIISVSSTFVSLRRRDGTQLIIQLTSEIFYTKYRKIKKNRNINSCHIL